MSWTLSAFADEAGNSCADQIAATQRAGLKRLDIRGIDGHNIASLPIETAKQIKEQLDAAEITVQMFGSPLGKIDIADDMSSELEKMRHLAQLAPVLGCNAVRIFSYYNAHGADHNQWQQESLARLNALKRQAGESGLVLFHENERHIFGDLGVDVAAIARELRDGQTFKTIFDFDNFNQSGEDVWATWERLRDVTDAIHLKDSSSENQHVPAGMGNGRVRDILIDALKRGWDGPLAIEPHLQHSSAVMATGPSGEANQQFANMSAPDAFHVACTTARQLLDEIGARVE